MHKKEIAHSISAYTNGSPFISIGQFAKMMHIGKDRARTLLSELEYIPNGRRKDYFVADVAQMLNNQKQI